MTGAVRRPSVAGSVLAALAVAKLALHAVASTLLAYGYMNDELYYLACADHLAWGYVDHPPLSIGVLWLVRATVGTSLPALRLLPALAGAVTLVLTGLLARQLGGGRAAQGLAALAVLAAPVHLAIAGIYSMNAFEPVFWTAGACLVVRLIQGADARAWLLLGGVVGLGLLNKLSMLWFAGGLGVGLLLTPQRVWLRTRWPWLGAAVALLVFAPHLVWQVQHDFPTLEFMRRAASEKMLAKSPLAFLGDQLLVMNPVLAPLWLGGLACYFLSAETRRYRLLAWIWVSVFVLLTASGSARSNYLAPAYPMLLAAGALPVERLGRGRRWRRLPAGVAALAAVSGALEAPFALPLLPPARYVAYERALGLAPPRDQIDELGPLPLHFALRFGWPEVTRAVSEAYATLTADERAGVAILAPSYAEAGAIDFFGRGVGLPRAISPHNSYWLWGPGDATGAVALVLGEPGSPLLALFEEAEPVARVACTYCMPDVARLVVHVCRRPHRPLAEAWLELKRFL